MTGRDFRIAPVHVACALALGETALGVTGRSLLTATDHVGSARVPLLAGEAVVTARVPLLAGEAVVTARGQAISRVVLVTARGLVDGLLLRLTIRGQRKEDGEPDVSGRRVWRW